MHQLRRDSMYVAMGVTVTFAVLLAIAVVSGSGLLVLMAIAPNRIRTILQEHVPTGIHWALVMAALLEGIYVYLLMLGQLISKRFGMFLMGLMGVIATLALIAGFVSTLE